MPNTVCNALDILAIQVVCQKLMITSKLSLKVTGIRGVMICSTILVLFTDLYLTLLSLKLEKIQFLLFIAVISMNRPGS